MKNIALHLVWVTGICLQAFILLSMLGMPYALFFAMFITGHLLMLCMVFKALTSPYSTNKTIRDWYRDNNIQH